MSRAACDAGRANKKCENSNPSPASFASWWVQSFWRKDKQTARMTSYDNTALCKLAMPCWCAMKQFCLTQAVDQISPTVNYNECTKFGQQAPMAHMDMKPLTESKLLIVLYLQRHSLTSHKIALESYSIMLYITHIATTLTTAARLHFSCLAAKYTLGQAANSFVQ